MLKLYPETIEAQSLTIKTFTCNNLSLWNCTWIPTKCLMHSICSFSYSLTVSTSELRGGGLAPWNRFKPYSKIFLLTVPWRYFFCGSFVFLCLVCVKLSRPLIAALWSLAGKGLTYWLSFVMFVFLSLSHLVSWVRCGTWLYRFLIFAAFLTFLTTTFLCFLTAFGYSSHPFMNPNIFLL